MGGRLIRPGEPLLTTPAGRRAGALLGCCAVIVAALGAAFTNQVRADWLDRAVDSPFIAWFSGHRGLGQWLVFPGSLAGAGLLSAVIIVTCLLAGRLNGAVLAAAALPVAEGLNEGLLKPLVHRTYRNSLVYPSGHATAVFAVAATVTVLLVVPPRPGAAGPWRRLVPVAAWLLAVIVAVALVGLRWHYFTDTVAGAAVGIGTVCGLALLLDRRAARRWLALASRAVARRAEADLAPDLPLPRRLRVQMGIPGHGGFGREPGRERNKRMKTKAAVLWGLHEKWQVEEVELDPPKDTEVLVKLTASGLCHSDEHLVTGDIPIPFPVVGGHEGAGKVVETGKEVKHVAEGDSVVLSFLPACGRCSYCARGMQNLCDLGMHLINGPQLDGSYRFHARGQGLGQMCLLGTFSEYTVVPAESVVKVDDGTALDKAALVGCGVTTGYGTAVRTAEVKPGDTVVVMGIGGIGINAVQGARIAGARNIIAIDPLEFKRTKALELGATHAASSLEEAGPMVGLLTRGQMADAFLITTGVAEGDYIGPALDMVAKRGKVVVTAVGHPADTQFSGSIWMLTMMEKQIRGSLYGSSNAQHDIPRMLELYNKGLLKLDELITREYALEEVNQGYEDMRNGVNIRGLIRY